MVWPKHPDRPSAGAIMISQRQTLAVIASTAGVLAPLATVQPLWLTALVALVLIWRGWLLWRRVPLPPGWLVTLAAGAGALGVGLHYHSLIGREPGVSLLCLFLALKLFEMRSTRDARVVLLLNGFLMLALFFFSQAIGIAALTLLNVVMLVTALILVTREPTPLAEALRMAASLLLQALPFMAALFFLFPRIASPLWATPTDSPRGLAGLAETMAPGSINQLTLSDAIAFRARFLHEEPRRRELYWRGPTMSDFDGRTWRPGWRGGYPSLPYTPSGRPLDYEITLEPHDRPWLFALDLPGKLPTESLAAPDYHLLAKSPIRNRLRYDMQSFPDYRAGQNESPRSLLRLQQLPEGFNPQAIALGQALRRNARSDADIIAALLDRFRHEPFTYTLKPPLLGRDSVDEFLFKTRRGFCEHFASSFVVVMRAAGLPARVVTGYQGGERNPVDGYWTIRQSDAHAWAEVWLADEGWRRVDPTAAIAPERIEQDLAAAVPSGDPLPLLIRPEFDGLRTLRYRWEAIANGWNQWVLGYDQRRQEDLLRRLGIERPDWQSLAALLAALCGGLMLGLTGWALRQRHAIDPVERLWQRFTRRMARAGTTRAPWEGPRDFGRRAGQAIPAKAVEIQAICALYEALRYGRVEQSADFQDFRRRVARFAP